jgi:hypothetical protein
VRLNWKRLVLAIFAIPALFLTGCSGINASGSVSPATFFLPGLGKAQPKSSPADPMRSRPEAVQLLAQSR